MCGAISCFVVGYGDHRDLHLLTTSSPTRRSSGLAQEIRGEIWPRRHARLRRDGREVRSLRHLGRKVALWPQIYGDRAGDLPGRRRWEDPARLAQGEGQGARGRSAGGRTGPLTLPLSIDSVGAACAHVLLTPDPLAKLMAARAAARTGPRDRRSTRAHV